MDIKIVAIDDTDGYISPLKIFEKTLEEQAKDFSKEFDNNVMRAVHKVGFDVDIDELREALAYDRDQYKKGFRNGYAKGKRDAVVHGYNTREEYTSLFECSECGWWDDDTYTGATPGYCYCPNCGAKMDEEVQDDG